MCADASRRIADVALAVVIRDRSLRRTFVGAGRGVKGRLFYFVSHREFIDTLEIVVEIGRVITTG